MAKGTDAFTASSGDAAATARTNPDRVFAWKDGNLPRPTDGADFATWLTYHEAHTPGGEFNELFARLDSGLEDALTHYGPHPTPGMPKNMRKARCGKTYQIGAANGNAGTSNLDYVTCVACLEAELAS